MEGRERGGLNRDWGGGGGLINFPPLKRGGEGGLLEGLDRGFTLSMTLTKVTIP